MFANTAALVRSLARFAHPVLIRRNLARAFFAVPASAMAHWAIVVPEEKARLHALNTRAVFAELACEIGSRRAA